MPGVHRHLRFEEFLEAVCDEGLVLDNEDRATGKRRDASHDLCAPNSKMVEVTNFAHKYRPERTRCPSRPATLDLVRRSGDGVSKLDWTGDSVERLEALAGAEDRHVAIVKHPPED